MKDTNPQFSNYLILGNEIWSERKLAFLKLNKVSSNGYYQVTVLDDDGIPHTMNKARFLMMKVCPIENMEYMLVDHINGIKTDDRLENLLWVTPSQNALKRPYYKRPNRNKTIVIEHIHTGVIELYSHLNMDNFEIPYITINTLAHAKQGSHESLKWGIRCYYLEDLVKEMNKNNESRNGNS